MKRTTSTLALALCATLLLSGCVAAIGNKGPSRPDSTTLGRELMDLKEAKDKGVISETEYTIQRDKLLQRK